MKKSKSKTPGRDLCDSVLSRISIHISLNAGHQSDLSKNSKNGARIVQNSKTNSHQLFSVSFIVPSFMESHTPVNMSVMGKEIFAIYSIIFTFSLDFSYFLVTFHQPHEFGSFLCAAVIPFSKMPVVQMHHHMAVLVVRQHCMKEHQCR